MKINLVIFILMINFFILSGNTLAIPEETQFIPFMLQTSNSSGKLLFSSNDPTEIIIEINTTTRTTRLSLYYTEHISGTAYNSKYKELFENDYLNISTKTIHVSIGLDNQSTFPANFTATGKFRIHENGYNANNEWESFSLFLATPRSLDLYQSEDSWVNNISINLEIDVITNGTLDLEYSSSDVVQYISLNQTGEYQYLINASFISLYFASEDYGRVTGSYALMDNGKLFTVDMDGFTMGIVIVLLGLVIKKRVKRNLI